MVTSFSTTGKVYGNNEITYGHCEMTIPMTNVGFENSVNATNHCEEVIWGYFGAGEFHLSGAYSGVVEYSGQQFTISNPFSPNIHEILTVYLEDTKGEEVKGAIRLSGSTRLDTALAVSKQAFAEGLPHPEKSIILARSDNPADALAASSLSGVKMAPILLTKSSSIDQSVLNEIKRLNPKKIYMLGGNSAISSSIEKKLETLGYDTHRIAGNTRYETAAKINDISMSVSKSVTNAIIANGLTIADALAASASAALTGTPIYLAKKDTMPIDLPKNIKTVDVYGGTAVISESVTKKLEKQGIKVNRVSGANRYETSVKAAEKITAAIPKVILVRGNSTSSTKADYPDAVVASSLASRFGAQILLVHPTKVNEQVKKHLQKHQGRVYVLGGQNAIPDDMLNLLGVGGNE